MQLGPANRKLLDHARSMRKAPMPLEKKMWSFLRDRRFRGLKFRRQQPIGPYIVDFVCAEHRLVVELDGDSHAEKQTYDSVRTEYLRSEGFRVIRIGTDVTCFDESDILTAIAAMLDGPDHPHPNPSP